MGVIESEFLHALYMLGLAYSISRWETVLALLSIYLEPSLLRFFDVNIDLYRLWSSHFLKVLATIQKTWKSM